MLQKALCIVYNDTERAMHEAGQRTTRMAQERSLWYILAYHLFREYPPELLHYRFEVTGMQPQFCIETTLGQPLITLCLDSSTAATMLAQALKKDTITQPYPLCAGERSLLFRVEPLEDGAKRFVPVVNTAADNEPPSYHTLLPTLVFGPYVFIPSTRCLVRLDYESVKLLAAHWHQGRVVAAQELSSFLQDNATALSLIVPRDVAEGQNFSLFADPAPVCPPNYKRLVDLPLIDRFESTTIIVNSLDKGWFEGSISFGVGAGTASLAQLLRARKHDQRFVATNAGLVDMQAPLVRALLLDARVGGSSDTIRSRRSVLLRLNKMGFTSPQIKGGTEDVAALRTLLEERPVQPLAPLRGLLSTLRTYQQAGVQWLLFLYDNGLGGLLCDDMGLGKTHQVLGLIIALKEQRGASEPVLIVCPTTVMYHWRTLIERFAPGLRTTLFYGTERTMDPQQLDVVLTSYGVLRNDSCQLNATAWGVVIFDEAQQLKNSATKVSRAAKEVGAGLKLCLTGTPIENALSDLKNLFDIVLPGYLGSDEEFESQFVIPIQSLGDKIVRQMLHTLIDPFMLRRLKETVLDELPEKIEDSYSCRLSAEQEQLYNEAVNTRGATLLAQISEDGADIPYLHVFALLNYLKRICDHPAVVLEQPEEYERYESGKWELFKELLTESLDSGRKVVVFTQYLAMIDIVALYLRSVGVDFVALSGSTRDRGGLVDRFNTQPQCRVFICSLLAGGVGIDLTAASVVIHYDRWWNAAREDQATDRVHRMGQKSSVQVFKLVTEGTLEEKIAATIARKKELARDVLKEDSPDSLKAFSRKELLELLQFGTR
jgi:superfamily II DNA or RNA helicase